jgi:hypothetical protein
MAEQAHDDYESVPVPRKRGGFRSVQGEGAGGGNIPRPKLHSVPTGPDAGPPAHELPQEKPNLRLIKGDISDEHGSPQGNLADEMKDAEPGSDKYSLGDTSDGFNQLLKDPTGKPQAKLSGATPQPKKPSAIYNPTKRNAEKGSAKQAATLAKDANKLTTPAGAAMYVAKHRKQLGVGGTILVLVMAIGLGLGLLSPLKLESMLKNMMERRVTNRIDHYLEKRLQNIVDDYLQDSVGKTDSEFGQLIAKHPDIVKNVMRVWRFGPHKAAQLGNFEANLELHQGIKFERITGGNGIRMYKDGQLVGDLNNRSARLAINQAVRDELRWYQFYKRKPMRQMMRIYYGVKGWRPYEGKSGDDAEKEVKEGSITEAQDVNAGLEGKELECIAEGDQCITDEGDPKDPGHTTTQADQKTGSDANADNTISDTAQQTASDAAQSAKDAVEKAPKQKLADRIIIKIFGQTIGPRIAAMIAASSGPLMLITAVDFASRVDHFLYPGTADLMIANIHKIEYAAQASHWLSRGDQIKAAALGNGSGSAAGPFGNGAPLTSDEFNATQGFISHIETAAAMQVILNGTHGGQSLTTLNDGTKAADARSIDEHKHPIAEFYRIAIGDVPFAGVGTIHTVLQAWFVSGHVIWDFLNSILGTLLSPVTALINKLPFVKVLLDNAAALITDALKFVVKTAVEGTEVDGDLGNGIDAGLAVIGADFSRLIGGHILTAADAGQLDRDIAVEHAQQDSKISLRDRIFSPNYTHSFVNTLAIAAPLNLQGAVADGAAYSAQIATSPYKYFGGLIQLLGGRAHADALSESDYGISDYGFSEADLGKPIDDAAIAAAQAAADKRLGHTAKFSEIIYNDCPDAAAGQANICRLDVAALQSAGSRYTTDDDGGINSPGGL